MFARYAFNELISFVAGWAIFLDYTILIAVTALTVPAYLAAFAAPIGRGGIEIAVALAVIALVAADNLTGVSARRLRPRLLITVADVILQALIIVLGLALVFNPDNLTASIHLGTAPSWSDLAFALPIAVIAFTGIEAAASIAGEVSATPAAGQVAGRARLGGDRADLRRDLTGRRGRAPGPHGMTTLGTEHIKAPVLGVVEAFKPQWLADVLKYAVAIGGAAGLFAAAGSAMLGVSRVGYSLATNRQIPSAVGRLHGRWGTPYVIIGAAAAGRRGARAAHRPRVPGRDLRLRRDARVHDRPRLGDRAALPRARPGTGLQRPVLGVGPGRRGADSGRDRGGRLGARLGGAARVPLPAPATSDWPGWRAA